MSSAPFRRLGILAPLAAGLMVTTAAAQSGGEAAASVATGAEVRGYRFGGGFAARSVHQVAVPLGFVIPIGRRLTVDAASSYAFTRRTDQDGSRESIDGLTDTQLRASLAIGRDVLVATVMVNLPTGADVDSTQLRATGAIASTFLSFPVNAYTNGTSVTGGLAVAGQVGGWSLGLASSVRYSPEYSPFAASDLKYDPGLETRVRLGADRLLGRARLTMGFTFSTFGTDRFGGDGFYTPGRRYIGEANLTAPMGNGSFSAYAWNYYRDDARASSLGVGSNSENLFAAGLSAELRVGSRSSFSPVLEGRYWSPAAGNGYLVATGGTLRLPLGPRVVVSPGAKLELGSVTSPAGRSFSVTGWAGSAYLRYTF